MTFNAQDMYLELFMMVLAISVVGWGVLELGRLLWRWFKSC
jgi:hypothetical protein